MPPVKTYSPAEIVALLGAVANVAVPPTFATEEGTISMEEILQHMPPVEQDLCQECGFPGAAIIHLVPSFDSYHSFVSRAGVAQSEERLPRKQEVEGSIPSASSKGFTETERDLMAKVVSARVRVEDQRKAYRETKISLDTYTKESEDKIAIQRDRLKRIQEQEALEIEHMEYAEAELKEAILTHVLVVGAPEPPKSVEEHEQEDIGRAD